MTDFTLRGRHVAATFIGAFGIIVAVNLTLAFNAVRSFPGLEVKNSYVASQTFDADRAAQQALGWDVMAEVAGDVLTLRIADQAGPVDPQIVQAVLGRATHVRSDRHITFAFDGDAHRASVPGLAPGNWNLRLVAIAADGTEFRQRIITKVAR